MKTRPNGPGEDDHRQGGAADNPMCGPVPSRSAWPRYRGVRRTDSMLSRLGVTSVRLTTPGPLASLPGTESCAGVCLAAI